MYGQTIADLKHFYASLLGRMTRQALQRSIQTFWPEINDAHLAGLGYACPFLRHYMYGKNRISALLPQHCGATHWPRGEANRTVLAEEDALPLADESVDYLLVIHALEHSRQVRPMLRECWRVLAPGGKVLFIVPNRKGLWAHVEYSPFGHGSPFSTQQLEHLCKDNLFIPLASRTALYMPPWRVSFAVRLARLWEVIGSLCFRGLGGVVCLEAEKQVYAPVMVGRTVKKRRKLAVPIPVAPMSKRIKPSGKGT